MVRAGLTTPARRIVLIGAGHAHLGVLEAFARRKLEGVEVVLVDPHDVSYYSGMIPAVIAGERRLERARIPLEGLAKAAGARFVQGRVVGVDRRAGEVTLEGGAALRFDRVSINAGAEPDLSRTPGAAWRAAPLKPFERFVAWWTGPARAGARAPASVAVIGGGLAGVEIALAMRRARPKLQVTVAEAAERFAPERGKAVSRLLAHAMRRARVQAIAGAAVVEVRPHDVLLQNGQAVEADAVVWAAGGAPPAFLSTLELPLAPDGRLAVGLDLAARADARVFAAGDCAAVTGAHAPPSGAEAVAQGETLADNLARAAHAKRPRPGRPPRRRLALVTTRRGAAIADWGWLTLEAGWAKALKSAIDDGYARRLQRLAAKAMGRRRKDKRPTRRNPGWG